jgi:LPS O-antigen subunit length determinant protein (WzzB/FepE family)
MDNKLNSIEIDSRSKDDIDINAILRVIWSGRKTILISLLICTIIGSFIAIFSPKEYTVTTVMVPQLSNSNKSQLSSLAALAGVDMAMTPTSDLSPLIYPKIINSITLKLELMKTPLDFIGVNHPVSIYEYYTKYSKPSVLALVKRYTIGIPSLILNLFKSKETELRSPIADRKDYPLYLTKTQTQIKKMLDSQISLGVEKKEGYLTLTVHASEPLVTAQLAKKTQELLQREITKFKIEKTQAELNFIQNRYNDAKFNFEKVQVSLASITDRNRDLTSGLSNVERDRIQTKYTIAYSVFQDLAKQLEQAKIQVKKDTPVFTIVDPVTIPIEKSKPNRPMILLMWIFLGVFVGVLIIYIKGLYIKIRAGFTA